MRPTYYSNLALPSAALVYLVHNLLTRIPPKTAALLVELRAIFHQFHLAWLELNHCGLASMNPWISGTHWPLLSTFSIIVIVDDEPDVILRLYLQKY